MIAAGYGKYYHVTLEVQIKPKPGWSIERIEQKLVEQGLEFVRTDIGSDGYWEPVITDRELQDHYNKLLDLSYAVIKAWEREVDTDEAQEELADKMDDLQDFVRQNHHAYFG